MNSLFFKDLRHYRNNHGSVMEKYALTLIFFFTFKVFNGQEIYYLPGSTQKIEQLVGDYDRDLKTATHSLSHTNYQIWGTDLGIPFVHKNRTYLLFGDIPGDIGFGKDRDPIAYTEDSDPSDGLDIQFLSSSPGVYLPISIPEVSQGAFEVPLDGISINDIMYIFHSTDNMTRSVLARSYDDGISYELVEDTVSVLNFINISVNKAERSNYPDVPFSSDQLLFAMGTGEYRASGIYLYCQPQESIEKNESRYFFSGFDEGFPQWSAKEEDAYPVIDIDCAGELSTAYNPYLEKWMVLYNCDEPRGIHCHFADNPWGPYGEAEILLEPWEDNAYCQYIHTSWDFMVCDSVHDPNREYEWGGEYGPYLFKEMTTQEDSLIHIYYTLSTWNPYTSVLMRSTLIKSEPTSHTNDIGWNQDFAVLPNPSDGLFQITWQNGTYTKADLFNLNGQFLESFEIENPLSNSFNLNVSDYKPSVYFIRVSGKKNHFQSKLILID